MISQMILDPVIPALIAAITFGGVIACAITNRLRLGTILLVIATLLLASAIVLKPESKGQEDGNQLAVQA